MVKILTQEEIESLLEVIDNEKIIQGCELIFLGKRYQHYKNKQIYIPIEFVKIQLNNEWVNGITYIKSPSCGLKFVRPCEEFLQKFILTDKDKNT